MQTKILEKGKKTIISHFRLVLFVSSLLISFTFFILQTQVVQSINISVSRQFGQLDSNGMYNFGDYTLQVNNLINSGSLISNDKVLNRYPPIYPTLIYLSVRISDISGLKLSYLIFIFTAFFIALSTLIIGEIANIFYKNKLFSFFAGILYTTHPYILQGLTKTMSGTPFMTFFYLSLFLYFIFVLKKKRSLIYPIFIGLLLGISMLIRPIGLFLPLLFSLFVMLHVKQISICKRILISLIILVASLITVLPWHIINYNHDQRILLSSDEVYSILDGVRFNNDEGKMHINIPLDVDSLATKLSTSGVVSKSEFLKFAFGEFINQPITMVKLILVKAARSWYGVFTQDSRKETIKQIIFLIYFSFTLFGVYKIKFKYNNWMLFSSSTVLLVLYFWGIILLVVPLVRYLYPIFGLMVIFIPAIFYKKK